MQEQRITESEHNLQEKEEARAAIERQLDIERFGLQRFSNDNSMISFYTGFTSFITPITFFNFITSVATNMQSSYDVSSETIRKRNMLLIDELFMLLRRLKVRLLDQDLNVRFNCSVSTVSRKIVTGSISFILLWGPFRYGCLVAQYRNYCQNVSGLMLWCLTVSLFLSHWYPGSGVVLDCIDS